MKKNIHTKDALNLIYNYLTHHFSTTKINLILPDLFEITKVDSFSKECNNENMTYDILQSHLSSINEKTESRKTKGVYYTPADVVKFILYNSIKSSSGKLKPTNMHVMDLNGVPYKSFCLNKTIFDPTCGTGEFLLAALNVKFDLLELHKKEISPTIISKVIETIYGNDIDWESTKITRLRLLMCVVNRYGPRKAAGISRAMSNHFSRSDYITSDPLKKTKHDIIIGNPPYVEDTKSGLSLKQKYGNIYANVLENAALQLKPSGTLGFIIPLSYVSTVRMNAIRERIRELTPEQYILSYADRPDCLFTSVHQKLSILVCRKRNTKQLSTYTSNYKYWYKNERDTLFQNIRMVKNNFTNDSFIPKLGDSLDVSVYKKTQSFTYSLFDGLSYNQVPLYLNMRAAFWIKAFLGEHTSGEYKTFYCQSNADAHYYFCLLNSSLFWWYWICVSDCWHITRKELINFSVPLEYDCDEVLRLATTLENALEDRKLYVNTVQTEYEYKHKECTEEIFEIDQYINDLYGLSEEESIYISNFAMVYRTGGN